MSVFRARVAAPPCIGSPIESCEEPMPYIIQNVQGPAPLAVGERIWGDATEINFGAMTSCIALVVQTPGQPTSVRGIHLSIVSGDGTPVYDPVSNVAGQVDTIMQQSG